jgi:hypothetical protein
LNGLASRRRYVIGNAFRCTLITGVEPVVDFDWELTEIKFVGADADDAMLELSKVPNDPFDTVEMTLARTCAKAGQCHDGSGDIKTTNLDGPLERPNEGLVDLGALTVEELGCVELGVITSNKR